MALKSGFFNSVGGDRKYGADDLSNIWVKFISNGVYANPATSMQVVAAGGMNVKVSPGWAFINSKWLKNDSDYMITLDDSDVEFDRLDRIVVRLDPSDEARAITIEVKKGTAADPTSVVPLTREDNGIWELSLAQIRIFANATEITQSAIIDQRADNEVCGWVTGLIDQIDTQNLFSQYDAAFKEFMESINSGELIRAIIGQRLKSTLTYFGSQLCGICNVIGEWERFPGKLSGYGISKEHYNPNKNDILMLWVNNELWELGKDYSLTDGGDYWRIVCDPTLYAPNLTVQIWNALQSSTGTLSGETISISDGVFSQALTGTTGQIIDLMDYDLITTADYTSSVPESGKYIEIKDFQKWFPVNSSQAIQIVFKYDDEEKQAVVRMKINGSHSGYTGSDDDYFVVSELSNYQGVATTVRPLIVVDGIADLSKLTQFYMIITEA